MKRVLLLLLALMLVVTAVGCGPSAADESAGSSEEVTENEVSVDGEEQANYKIGIVTPTMSTSEDEYRAAENMVAKYPEIVKHITLPENFATEIETGLSQITSLADDPEMKAIIVISGQSGLLPALQKSGGSTTRYYYHDSTYLG